MRNNGLKFDDVVSAVTKAYRVTRRELMSDKRPERIAYPRQVAMYLMRVLLGASFAEIGDYFGGKDHGTAMHAYKRIAGLLPNSKESADVSRLTKAIKPVPLVVGDRYLVLHKRETKEVAVEEITDSGEYVKLSMDGAFKWLEVGQVKVLDALSDKANAPDILEAYVKERSGIREIDWTDVEARFWANVKKTDGCWEWTGVKNTNGYGQLGVGSLNVLAHRLSYAFNKGPITNGMLVCHTCDNPGCVKPEHLFIGTHKDNVHDMIRKGRAKFYGRDKPITPAVLTISGEKEAN